MTESDLGRLHHENGVFWFSYLASVRLARDSEQVARVRLVRGSESSLSKS